MKLYWKLVGLGCPVSADISLYLQICPGNEEIFASLNEKFHWDFMSPDNVSFLKRIMWAIDGKGNPMFALKYLNKLGVPISRFAAVLDIYCHPEFFFFLESEGEAIDSGKLLESGLFHCRRGAIQRTLASFPVDKKSFCD